MHSTSLLVFVSLVLCMSIGYSCYLTLVLARVWEQRDAYRATLNTLRQRLIENGLMNVHKGLAGKEKFSLNLEPRLPSTNQPEIVTSARVNSIKHRRLSKKENQ